MVLEQFGLLTVVGKMGDKIIEFNISKCVHVHTHEYKEIEKV